MTCPTLIWTSDNTSIATVNSSGLITGVSAGTANVTAKSGTVTSNLSTITVTAVPEKKFSVFNITPGDTANNVGVLAILDDSGTLTKDQACAEVCTRLGQI